MKKLYVGIAVVALLAVGFGAVGIASADEHTPGERQRGEGNGEFRELFLENMAEALGTTREELQSRVDDGEKLCDVLADYGYEGEALQELKESVKQETVAEALADGLITEEQAEKILSKSGRKGPGRGNGGERPDGEGAEDTLDG